MSGPKRNPDKLNTIGVVVVGICGAVLVYVTIVALQAFYMNDTSEIQTMKDYGGQDTTAKGKRADELANLADYASNPGASTYRIKIEDAINLVIEDAKKDPSHLTGSKMPPSVTETIPPAFGRPKVGGETAAPPAGGAPAGAPTTPPAGAGGAAPAGGAAGSAAPTTPGAGSAATQTPTGSGPVAPAAAPARSSSPSGAQPPATPPAGAQPPRRNP